MVHIPEIPTDEQIAQWGSDLQKTYPANSRAVTVSIPSGWLVYQPFSVSPAVEPGPCAQTLLCLFSCKRRWSLQMGLCRSALYCRLKSGHLHCDGPHSWSLFLCSQKWHCVIMSLWNGSYWWPQRREGEKHVVALPQLPQPAIKKQNIKQPPRIIVKWNQNFIQR